MAHLTGWSPDRAWAVGLADVAQGDLVDIEGSGAALVTALYREVVELTPLSSRAPRETAGVHPLGPLVTPTGDDLMGRLVDCLATPIDDGPPIAREQVRRILDHDPSVFPSRPKRLTLGTLVFDLQRVLPTGVSVVALCPPRARDIVHHIVRHQHAAGRVCVMACPARAGLLRPLGDLSPPLDIPRITVSIGEHSTPAAQWLVPWTAMAIAASLRDRGRDVVVILDDVDAWRFPVGRAENHGSWPTQLGRLAARAYAGPRGSVSLIAVARENNSALAASFDTILDLEAVARGDLGRTNTSLVRPPIKVQSPQRLGAACMTAARLHQIEAVPWLQQTQPSSVREAQDTVDEGRRIRECLRFRPDGTVDSLEQILCLLATLHLRVPVDAIGAFLTAYVTVLRRDHAHRLTATRDAQLLSDPDRDALLAVAERL
jgi:F0F1-type ATP synthase alpha subunit